LQCEEWRDLWHVRVFADLERYAAKRLGQHDVDGFDGVAANDLRAVFAESFPHASFDGTLRLTSLLCC
jgi:hypothetical protein